ncbi:MAG: DNA repair protein RecO [Nitrospirae bacterium GWC2_56_14]|nr:MAG: DNA repair protein RecO [Nitrospirae bacterium GWC2_56_14]
MRSKTEAIIISSMNLGEADKLVTFFSLDRGMQKGVAKNARKSFRRFGAGLESFTYCRLHLHEREHQDLLRIESADILTQASAICDDLQRAAVGAVILELVRELAPPGERNATAFLLLANVLQLLNRGEEPVFLLRVFEIRFLSLLGYQPKLDHCLSCGRQSAGEMVFHGMKGGVLCSDCMVSSGDPQVRISPGAIGFYYQALRMDMDKICRLKPSAAIMQELDRTFSDHTFHILGKRLKSTEFLRSVCSI